MSSRSLTKRNKLCYDASLLKISKAGRYTAVFSKLTVYNAVIFNTAIFFDTGIPRIPSYHEVPNLANHVVVLSMALIMGMVDVGGSFNKN